MGGGRAGLVERSSRLVSGRGDVPVNGSNLHQRVSPQGSRHHPAPDGPLPALQGLAPADPRGRASQARADSVGSIDRRLKPQRSGHLRAGSYAVAAFLAPDSGMKIAHTLSGRTLMLHRIALSAGVLLA